MTGLPKRAARALHWRVNALQGTGATKVPREPERPHATQEVGEYYDRFTQTYLDATGPFLQAFRGRDTDALMEYYVARCDLADGMEIVDAGCGVGGPAIWLARRFPAMKIECLTNSQVQADRASAHAAAAGVEDRVNVRLGDYHDLSRTYPHDRFDRVLFLETLGHSEDIRRVHLALGRAIDGVKNHFIESLEYPHFQALLVETAKLRVTWRPIQNNAWAGLDLSLIHI